MFEPKDYYDPTKDKSVKVGGIHIIADKREAKMKNAFARYAAVVSNSIFIKWLQRLPVHEGTYEIPEGYEARVILTRKMPEELEEPEEDFSVALNDQA